MIAECIGTHLKERNNYVRVYDLCVPVRARGVKGKERWLCTRKLFVVVVFFSCVFVRSVCIHVFGLYIM